MIRRARFLISLGFSVLLSGCFLEQPQAGPPQPVGTTIEGLVSLEDFRFGNEGTASIEAEFWVKGSSGNRSESMLKGSRRRGLSLRASFEGRNPLAAARGRSCTRKTEPITPKPRDEQTGFLDAGAITFQSPESSKVMTLVPSDKHVYHLGLPPQMPTNTYMISIAGNSQIRSVPEASFYVPEPLAGVRVNGSEIVTSGSTIKKSQAVKFEWYPHTFPDDHEIILFKVITQNDKEKHALTCIAGEDDVITESGMGSWELDPSWFSELDKTNTAEILFARGWLARVGLKDVLEMDFESIRSLLSIATVTD